MFIDKKAGQSYKIFRNVADLAQLVELLICNQWVGGSSPSVGTIKKASRRGGFFYGINLGT